MNVLTAASLHPHEPSIYTRHYALEYLQNATLHTKQVLSKKNSVQIILYNTTNKKLVFVKQFRPSIYAHDIPVNERPLNAPLDVHKYPAENAFTLELCGGLLDKDASEEETAREEVFEECGYRVGALERVWGVVNQIADSGTQVTVYYCEVNEDMKAGSGGGVDDEVIDVVEMSVGEVFEYCEKDVRSPGLFLAAFWWFVRNKLN